MHVWYRFVLFKWNNSTILYQLNGLDHVKPVCFDGQLSFNEHLPVIKNHWICLFGPHSIQWNGCKRSFEWHLPLLHALLNLVRYGHNAFFMKSTFSKSNGKQGSKNPSPLHKSSKTFSYISELPERKTHKYLRNSHVKTQCCKSHQGRLLLFALLYQSCVSNSCWVLFFPIASFRVLPSAAMRENQCILAIVIRFQVMWYYGVKQEMSYIRSCILFNPAQFQNKLRESNRTHHFHGGFFQSLFRTMSNL